MVQTVERVARLLLAFTDLGSELGVRELSRHLNLAKSVVHRMLVSLAQTGLVAQDPETGRYRLGPRALDLGLAALGAVDLPGVALPVMAALRDETLETITLSLRAGDRRTYAAQLESPQTIRMTVELGRSWPLYAGASGRAILAYLPAGELERYLADNRLQPLTERTITDPAKLTLELDRVQQRGYAASAGERDPLASAVAAPIRARGGEVVGSISICGPTARFTPDQIFDFGDRVRRAAAQISASLGYRPDTGADTHPVPPRTG